MESNMESKIVFEAIAVDLFKEKKRFLDEKDGVTRFIENEFVFDNSDELPESLKYYPRLRKCLRFKKIK